MQKSEYKRISSGYFEYSIWYSDIRDFPLFLVFTLAISRYPTECREQKSFYFILCGFWRTKAIEKVRFLLIGCVRRRSRRKPHIRFALTIGRDNYVCERYWNVKWCLFRQTRSNPELQCVKWIFTRKIRISSKSE